MSVLARKTGRQAPVVVVVSIFSFRTSEQPWCIDFWLCTIASNASNTRLHCITSSILPPVFLRKTRYTAIPSAFYGRITVSARVSMGTWIHANVGISYNGGLEFCRPTGWCRLKSYRIMKFRFASEVNFWGFRKFSLSWLSRMKSSKKLNFTIGANLKKRI